jgi:HEPN domain-containing protein
MREAGEGLRWLEQAQEDLRWTRALLEQGGYYLAAFLSQQVAEKSLKAVLYARGADAAFGHSVERLTRDVAEASMSMPVGAARWSALDVHYVTARYPNSLPGSIPARVYDRKTAEEAVGLAAEVVAFAERTLGEL